MEWVETTAKTVDEAKELALDQLGVSVDDAEFEVVEEPKPGLFGRIRGEARIRARVRPTTPRAKSERREARPKRARRETADTTPGSGEAGTDGASPRSSGRAANRPARGSKAAAKSGTTSTAGEATPGGDADELGNEDLISEQPGADDTTSGESGDQAASKAVKKAGSTSRPRRARTPDAAATTTEAATTTRKVSDVSAEQVGAEAVRFLEGLVESFGITATTEVQLDGDEIEVRVDGDDVGVLIGPRGATLLAIQDITRVVAQRRLGDHETRLRVDIGGYRERRRAALAAFTIQQADAVRETGTARALEPMPSADRKVIHDTVATIAGVVSRSDGDDPYRRVVIAPAGDTEVGSS